MPIYYVIVNAAFVALVLGVVVSLLLGAISTQHRDPDCSDVRLGRLRLPTRNLAPRPAPAPSAAPVLPDLRTDDLAPATGEIALV